MDRRHVASTALISVPALVLGLSIGGGAYAAHKIGKNLVVTKSIKNGAVTSAKLRADAVDGSKVKDGSLTASDLAPGTIPAPIAPQPSRSLVSASTDTVAFGNNDVTVIAPFGSDVGGTGVHFAIAPFAIQVADLHANTSAAMAANKTLTFELRAGTTLATQTTVLSCTVEVSQNACTTTQTATIPAGSFYSLRMVAGPNGASNTLAVAAYSVRVP